MYQSLSPRDQALVSQGQIRAGMTMDAVWWAGAHPIKKIPDNMDVRSKTTWVYLRYGNSTTGPYYLRPFQTGRISLQSSCTVRGVTSRTAEFGVSDTSLHVNWVVMICSRHERVFRIGVGCLRQAASFSPVCFNAPAQPHRVHGHPCANLSLADQCLVSRREA